MTPSDIIKHEERVLKERLEKDVADIITNHVQNFIDKTGLKIYSVDFKFLDVSTADRKQVIFCDISGTKETL
jgi:hypothetical protein